MRRLVWVAVGAGLAIVVVRRSRAVAQHYLPAGTTEAVDLLSRVTTAARTARTDFLVGIAEREDELRRELIGDVDIDALRDERARNRAAASSTHGNGAGKGKGNGASGNARRASRGWADRPTEDPDDGDGDLPYSFY